MFRYNALKGIGTGLGDIVIRFNGKYNGKVITPQEDVTIPVDVPLRITVEPEDDAENGVWQRLLRLADDCSVPGPADLAANHDHYAHGKPIE